VGIVKRTETILRETAAMRKLLFTVAAIAACAPSGGCAVMLPVAAAGVGMAAVQDRSAGQVMDDANDYTDVKARLMAVDAEGFAQTHVQVFAHDLLLTGSVPDEAHRQQAEMIARGRRNLHNVYDELVVGQPASFTRGLRDGVMETSVRARLLASSHVRAVDINIEVYNGNVYLMGTARSDAELREAAEIASRVGGVRRVVSFMEVIENAAPNYYASAAPPAPEYAANQSSVQSPAAPASGAPLNGAGSY
jgi:osmotically-inducible protein OsmY